MARESSISKSRDLERALADKISAVDEAHELRRKMAETHAKVVEKEVIKYVESDYSGHCQLPNGWVRIDTEAATGVPSNSGTASVTDDSPSGFTDTDALRVMVDRTKVCKAEIDKLKSLQDYVRSVLGK